MLFLERISNVASTPVAHRRSLGNRAGFVGRRAGKQEPFKFLAVNRVDEWLADLGEDHTIKGVALDGLAADQPVEEGASGASIGLDGAFGAWFAVAARTLAHVCKPGIDIGGVDLAHQADPTFLFKVRPHEPQGSPMPVLATWDVFLKPGMKQSCWKPCRRLSGVGRARKTNCRE